MVRSAKRMLAALLAIAMIAAFIPATQENAFAAKAKKPAKVKDVKVTVAKNNKVTITWKKAKNAKKYNVSIKDGSSKLTSVKASKKTKLTFQGGSAVRYTIKVQGVNGKKKGAFSKAVNKKTNEVVSPAVQKDLDEAKEAQAKAEEAQKAAEEALKEAEEAKTAAEQRASDAEAELAQMKKEKADKEAAELVAEAWNDSPDIDEDASEEDIAAVKAVIAAYDELTDDQKKFISDDVKEGIENDRETIAKIEEAKVKIEEIKKQIRDIEAGSTDTVSIDGKEYLVIAKESGKARLILKDGISGKPFDTDKGDDWGTSSLRDYLNGDWLSDNPELSKLAEETTFAYKIQDTLYVDNDEFEEVYGESEEVFIDKTSEDKVSIISFDDFNELSKTVQALLAQNGQPIWSSTGFQYKFQKLVDPDFPDQYGVYALSESVANVEYDTSITVTSFDGGVTNLNILTNPAVWVDISE